jgi:C_GCAxxG_C_C family probable redox protein
MKHSQAFYVDYARKLREQGYNCAQAAACSFFDEVSLSQEMLYKISEGFGGGMGTYDGTCGALSGGIMIISLVHSNGNPEETSKKETYRWVSDAYEAFVDAAGSAVCRELQGLDTGVTLFSCASCIDEAVRITYTLVSQIQEGRNR